MSIPMIILLAVIAAAFLMRLVLVRLAAKNRIKHQFVKASAAGKSNTPRAFRDPNRGHRRMPLCHNNRKPHRGRAVRSQAIFTATGNFLTRHERVMWLLTRVPSKTIYHYN